MSILEQFKSNDDKASETDGNMIKVGEFPTLITIKCEGLDHEQLSFKESGDEMGCDDENVSSSTKAIVDVTSSEPLSMDKASPDFSCRSQHEDDSNALMLHASSDEPMYEGEECLNAMAPVCEDKEPVYEGESLLGKGAE